MLRRTVRCRQAGSTVAAAAASAATTTTKSPPSIPLLKVDLTKPESIYSHLKTWEIMRAIFVYRICSMRWVVKSSVPLLKLTEKVLGRTLTYNNIVKWTMFRHFCAGVDELDIRFALQRLAALRIGPILDYAAEADPDEVQSQIKTRTASDAAKAALKKSQTLDSNLRSSLRNDTLEYDRNEMEADRAAGSIFTSISHTSQNVPPSGIAYCAVKLSSLVDQKLLVRASAMLLSLRQGWASFFLPVMPPLEDCRVVINVRPEVKRTMPVKDFIKALRSLCQNKITEAEAEVAANFLDKKSPHASGTVDYLDYTNYMGVAMLSDNPVPELLPVVKSMPNLTIVEREVLHRFEERLDRLMRHAVSKNVRVMVDAEQSYLQMAIDHYVREMQRRFNKEQPIVANTYQCYLKYTKLRLENDIARSHRESWRWAGKVVRGAYLLTEADLAAEHGYPSPLFENKELTDICYNECAKIILDLYDKKEPINAIFGSHNVESMQLIADRVYASPNPEKREIAFAQLFGMGDHLSIPLARAGYNTFKYVAYGPVNLTVLYLQRRAVENAGMLAQGFSERAILWRELKKRFGM